MVDNTSRRELLKKVQEADFFALDLQLYLNTHPDCARALALYQDAVKKAKDLRKEYEKTYGPLTATSTPDKLPWQWSRNPWTWEIERS
jgi:spore coat protein JB